MIVVGVVLVVVDTRAAAQRLSFVRLGRIPHLLSPDLPWGVLRFLLETPFLPPLRILGDMAPWGRGRIGGAGDHSGDPPQIAALVWYSHLLRVKV